jgi:hypothetical protein
MDRNFLFRVAEKQMLEKREEIPFGCCTTCGRDIFRWEILNEYSAIDGRLYCTECLIDRQSKKNRSDLF